MKKDTIILLAMGLCTIVVIAIIAGAVQSSATDDTKELHLVHIIVRHGIRTPVNTYPKDPFINETFYPIGWGRLTNDGKMDLYNLGKFLRNRYDKFLGDFYSPTIYYAQSTDTDRAITSLQLINAGFWTPGPVQQWGPLNWQPIPVHYEPLDKDSLLLVRKPCAQYSLELERVENLPEIQEKLLKHRDLFRYLAESTGKIVNIFDDVQDIYTTLQAEVSFNLTLPSWTHGYFPEKMQEPAEFSYVLRAYNSKLKRLKGGLLLRKLIEDWRNVTQGTLNPKERKAFLYGGHDSTISNLLSSLNIFDPQIPGYGVAILLEFSRDLISQQYGLEVYFRNSTNSVPYKLVIPGCENFCPFEKLLELTKNVIPEDWEEECATDDPNYVPPPPGEP